MCVGIKMETSICFVVETFSFRKVCYRNVNRTASLIASRLCWKSIRSNFAALSTISFSNGFQWEFACTRTTTNGLECVSAPFMLSSGVFSLCPFQQYWVGDRLSPLASLTKVRRLRFALFNFCFLHSGWMMLYAFCNGAQSNISSSPTSSVFLFISSISPFIPPNPFQYVLSPLL